MDFAPRPTGINDKVAVEEQHCLTCGLRRCPVSEVKFSRHGVSESGEDLGETDIPEAGGPFSETKQLPR